ETGEVKKVLSGDGLSLAEVTHHPDTGAALVGAHLPNWDRMKQAALEGARLMHEVGLIGWDMASTPDGPVIVEMNVTPDLGLCQLADARGMLDDTFTAFIAYQKRCEREQKNGRK
ncbi:MAG: sugar-transfer associated ATP-grasp domain-containing protein, partial [Hyphomicrobiaceae bacterium]